MLFTGMITQALSGFYQFNLALYVQILFLEILLNTSFMMSLGFFIHTLVNQRFAGHVILISLILVRSYLPAWGLEHPLFRYGGLSLGRYSDLTGFDQANVIRFGYYAFYWMGMALLLFALSRLLVVRGIETGIKTRLKLLVKRFSKPARVAVGMGLILFVGTGSSLYVKTNRQHEYQSIKEIRAHRALYEKALKQYEGLPAPQITAVQLAVQLYPEQDHYTLKGTYTLKNPWKEPIDRLFVQGNLNPKVQLDSLSFSTKARLDQPFEDFHAALYAFDQPLLPGDSMLMHFSVNYSSPALAVSYTHLTLPTNREV